MIGDTIGSSWILNNVQKKSPHLPSLTRQIAGKKSLPGLKPLNSLDLRQKPNYATPFLELQLSSVNSHQATVPYYCKTQQ